jgi:hypothetical protein
MNGTAIARFGLTYAVKHGQRIYLIDESFIWKDADDSFSEVKVGDKCYIEPDDNDSYITVSQLKKLAALL